MNIIKHIKRIYSSLSLEKRAAIWFIICGFMQKGVTFLTTPLFTRILSTEQFGYWTLFQSWETVFSILITLNLTSGCYMQSLVKFSDRKDDLTSSFATLLTTLMVFFFIFFLIFSHPISTFIGLPARYITAMFISIWSTCMYLFWTVRQRVDLNYRGFVILSFTYTFVVSFVGVVCVVLSPAAYKADARIFSYSATCFILFAGVGIRHFLRGKEHFSFPIWRRALRYNLPLVPHYMSQAVLNQFSRAQVNFYCGVSAAGIFGLAYSVGMAVQMLNSSVLNVLTPWMYKKLKYNEQNSAKKNLVVVFLLIFSACLLIMAITPELVSFFAPPEYSSAIWIVPPIAACVYFMFAQNIFDNYILYYEKTGFLSAASIIAAVMNVCLNAILIPWFGYIAAGYSLLICFVLSSFFHCIASLVVVRKQIDSTTAVPAACIFFLGVVLLLCLFVLLLLHSYFIIRYVLAVFVLLIISISLFRMKKNMSSK